MFSRILVKLVDQAILPAVLLVATRVVSVVLISKHIGIILNIGVDGFTFETRGDYVLVNSYSILAMTLILTLGLVYILFKAYVFHDTHIKPHHTAKLFTLELSSVIQSSYEIYTQGTIWLSYVYLLTLVSGTMSVYKLVFGWVFYFSLVLALISTVLLILDIEHEVDISKGTIPSLDTDWELEEGVSTYA